MYQSFIILFREILEISIILSVVIAATNKLKHRNFYIIVGIILGILGASIIAIFTNQITNSLDGSGQEIINAIILLVASGFISWTIIWMKKHGKELTKTIKAKGLEIKSGESSLFSLMLIIALAIFREGSEIVLFTYSLIATNPDSIARIIIGGLGGLLTGGIIGLLIYLGIIKFSGKYLFNITTILLAFIAASMAAQAGIFLQAAGYFSAVNAQPLWDSSWLISNQSIIGNFLNIMLGYNSKPTIIELIFYSANLLLIWLAVRIIKKSA